MILLCLIVALCFIMAYCALFLRPKYRLLSACTVFCGLFFLLVALVLALPEIGSGVRMARLMLAGAGIAAVGLGAAHLLFESGRHKPAAGADDHAREYTP